MQTYENWDILEQPLGSPYFRIEIERFLEANGLRMESLDSYYVIRNADDHIIAGAGICSDIIKCVAVDPAYRSEGLMAPLISHIIGTRCGRNIKVFTKPEYQTVFESLGFKLLARASKAILMEKGRGLERYVSYLQEQRLPGSGAVIVMNANPFHNGHLYLVQKAMGQVSNIYVIVVKEDVSRFPYEERLSMVREGLSGLGVKVLEGSYYQISAATFPSYFLKKEDDASAVQMELDVDLFCNHIAPALGASVRFVGSEPSDPLTAKYNETMARMLPERGLELKVVERMSGISGTEIRSCSYSAAKPITPVTTWPYLLADKAEQALLQELDTPLKPGLVGPDGCGAHSDMDYELMKKGIKALRPFWSLMATAATPKELMQRGIEAEKAMMEATGGVNTHRGAIFCIGLMLNAAYHSDNELHKSVSASADAISGMSEAASSHGREAYEKYGVKGAMAYAISGYPELFESWLPYYRETQDAQKLLLKIMSSLDDTCIIHRVGYDRAQEVKKEAAELLAHFSQEKLSEMAQSYAGEGISPGGAADMLSLTILVNSL